MTSAPLIARLRARLASRRTAVTLCYAQSLDGSIAAERGATLRLSNRQTQTLVHEIRALHDAIVVGINTVIADDPRLTVRLAAGRSPRPVILDSRLRLPPVCRLLQHAGAPPIVATTPQASARREKRLTAAGAEVIRVAARPDGRVDLAHVLDRLNDRGIRTVMIEGGGEVIADALRSEVVDQLVVTIAPRLVGGVPAIAARLEKRLKKVEYFAFGADMVVVADL